MSELIFYEFSEVKVNEIADREEVFNFIEHDHTPERSEWALVEGVKGDEVLVLIEPLAVLFLVKNRVSAGLSELDEIFESLLLVIFYVCFDESLIDFLDDGILDLFEEGFGHVAILLDSLERFLTLIGVPVDLEFLLGGEMESFEKGDLRLGLF